MSDLSSVPAATGAEPPRDRWSRRRTALLVLIFALVVGLTGAFATGAFSRGGFGFGPGHHFGSMSPGAIEDRADRMVRHLGIEIDATAEQQERLRAVVKGAVRDLLPMREKAQAARAQARELLTQPSINRAEIERFRRALDASDRQLERIKHKIEAQEADHYNIITAHQLILHDEHLVDETIRNIRDRSINAEWALRKTVEHIKGIFEAVEDDYFRERRSDVEFGDEREPSRNGIRETGLEARPRDVTVALLVAHGMLRTFGRDHDRSRTTLHEIEQQQVGNVDGRKPIDERFMALGRHVGG